MRPTEGRIPEALKAVFLASNQGQEVYVPPADHSAFKVFQRNDSNSSSQSTERSSSLSKKPSTVSPSSLSSCVRQISPQSLLHRKLIQRGYFPRTFCSKESGYYNAPTAHQLASYGVVMTDIVKRNQANELRRVLEAGLSPNACNQSGESLLHLVCRHDKVDLFRVLVAFDVDIQQVDCYGRTAMHDACWASNPSFEIAKCLIQRDPNFLFLYDDRGMHPLSYVTKANWGIWEDFLDGCIDDIFPVDNQDKNKIPSLCRLAPNTRPVPDPKHKIDATLANMVASGAMTAMDAIIAVEADDETTVACSEIDADYNSCCSVSSSPWDSDYDSSEEEDDDDDYNDEDDTEDSRLETIEEDQ